MRYLLLIPALMLFLSYVPFVHKMNMKKVMAEMKKSGCCKKAGVAEGSKMQCGTEADVQCGAGEETASAEEHCGAGEKPASAEKHGSSSEKAPGADELCGRGEKAASAEEHCGSVEKAPGGDEHCGPVEQSASADEHCGSAGKPASTDEHCGNSEKPDKSCSHEKGNCAKQDATCICICCFQYASPDQLGEKLHFGIDINTYELAGYVPQNWKDPQLMAPWQPPDIS